MKEGQTILSQEAIKEIWRLYYKKGWSSIKIGKKYHRCHQAILYHLGRLNTSLVSVGKNNLRKKPYLRKKPLRKYASRTYDGIGGKPSEIPEFIRKNLEAREAERLKRIENENQNNETERDKKTKCVVCGGKKSIKWAKTKYCSIKHWDESYHPLQKV